MASLSDDLVVEILSRLPVKTLCRCKCVSRHWRSLISHADYRRKLSQTHPGLFYSTLDSRRFPQEARHFTHIWEGRRHPLVCPSLSFLPGYERISILDCCNGMLLCRFTESNLQDAARYVVCNPVEKTSIVLPDSGCGDNFPVVRLAFDPALYPHFHVFEFDDENVFDDEDVDVFGANIYSSLTGAWNYEEYDCCPESYLVDEGRSVFYNGFLHLLTVFFEVLAVDMEGDTWNTIPLPNDAFDYFNSGTLGIYKGHLCYIAEAKDTDDLSIWILEDYKKETWVMKHQVSLDLLLDKQIGPINSCYYYVIGILQDCNFIIYLAGNTLMAYDADAEEVHSIQNLEQGCSSPFFLYVPFYTSN